MAKYTMRQVPQGLGKHPSQHPRLISEGRLSTKDLSERMAEGCTFSRAEIEGVLQLLGEELAKRLAEGYIVHIDGVGSFRPKLGYRKEVAPPKAKRPRHAMPPAWSSPMCASTLTVGSCSAPVGPAGSSVPRITATHALERVVSSALASSSAIYAPTTPSPVANM